MPPETLSQFWLENVRRYRGSAKIAVRQKNLGIWQAYSWAVSYTHLRAHETVLDLVCRLLLEKKKKEQ